MALVLDSSLTILQKLEDDDERRRNTTMRMFAHQANLVHLGRSKSRDVSRLDSGMSREYTQSTVAQIACKWNATFCLHYRSRRIRSSDNNYRELIDCNVLHPMNYISWAPLFLYKQRSSSSLKLLASLVHVGLLARVALESGSAVTGLIATRLEVTLISLEAYCGILGSSPAIWNMGAMQYFVVIGQKGAQIEEVMEEVCRLPLLWCAIPTSLRSFIGRTGQIFSQVFLSVRSSLP